MADSPKWLPVIGIIGLGCLGIGVYSVTQNYINQENSARVSPTPKVVIINQGKVFPQISVPLTCYDPSHTKSFGGGPKILKGRDGNSYLSMGRYGTLAYTVRIEDFPKGEGETIRVLGNFSSELSSDKEKQADLNNVLGSDVKLLVNGKTPANEAIQRAMSDSGYGGGDITWVVDAKLFKGGNNLLEFQVIDGPYGNGLAVWKDILIELPERAAQ